MSLRCYLQGIKCPAYKHVGNFIPTDEIVTPLMPDLRHCAKCMAHANPARPDLEDHLMSEASLVLMEKGPLYNPQHESGANFGSFIRPQICGALTDAKKKECRYSEMESGDPYGQYDATQSPYAEVNADIGRLWNLSVPSANPLDGSDYEVFAADFKALRRKLLKKLTPNERHVLLRIREGVPNVDIAAELGVTPGRSSQLKHQAVLKMEAACREFGILE